MIREMASLHDTLFQELARAGLEARRAFSVISDTSERQRQLLLLLHEHGELSHATLQQRLDADGATVTRLVKQLESEEAVNRRLDPTDNRFTLVSLTETGKQLAADVHEARRQFQRRLLAGVNREEQKTVIRVLEQVRTNLESIAHRDDQRAAKVESADAPRTRKR
jgi:DNA-binding MarR family transcriptional regulator